MNSESLCTPGDQPKKERGRERERKKDRHGDQSSDGAKVFYSTLCRYLYYKIAIFSRDKIKTYKLPRKHEVIHMKERVVNNHFYHTVHKKEEGTYHGIEKLTKEMPGFLSPRRGLPLLLIPEYSGINKNREFLTDPKQHTGSLLLNAS